MPPGGVPGAACGPSVLPCFRGSHDHFLSPGTPPGRSIGNSTIAPDRGASGVRAGPAQGSKRGRRRNLSLIGTHERVLRIACPTREEARQDSARSAKFRHSRTFLHSARTHLPPWRSSGPHRNRHITAEMAGPRIRRKGAALQSQVAIQCAVDARGGIHACAGSRRAWHGSSGAWRWPSSAPAAVRDLRAWMACHGQRPVRDRAGWRQHQVEQP